VEAWRTLESFSESLLYSSHEKNFHETDPSLPLVPLLVGGYPAHRRVVRLSERCEKQFVWSRAEEERIRFYSEREEVYGESAWPAGRETVRQRVSPGEGSKGKSNGGRIVVHLKKPALIPGSVPDRAVRVLKKLGADQHLTTAELAALVGVTPHTFREHSCHPALKKYKETVCLSSSISETGHGGPCVWWRRPGYDASRDTRLDLAVRRALPAMDAKNRLKKPEIAFTAEEIEQRMHSYLEDARKRLLGRNPKMALSMEDIVQEIQNSQPRKAEPHVTD
jgi:hypothetical protein